MHAAAAQSAHAEQLLACRNVRALALQSILRAANQVRVWRRLSLVIEDLIALLELRLLMDEKHCVQHAHELTCFASAFDDVVLTAG